MILCCPFLCTSFGGRSVLAGNQKVSFQPEVDREGLRIIHVTSAGKLIYGAVHSMLTLTNAQRSAGHDVSFVTFKGRPFTQELRHLGWTARDIRVRIKIDPLAILEMRKHFRAQKADIVHTHLSTSSVNGTLAARLARVPCVSTVHGMSGKLSYVFADHMIGVSQGVCDHLVQQGVARDKVTAVYNGVQLPKNHLSKLESREKFGIPSEALVIGTVARLTAMKGLDFSLTAFQTIAQQVPHAHYVLVGDGDDRARYEQMVKELGIAERVHFLGYQDPVFDPLAAMDLFLFPSLKEAMGIAVVEAMSLGMPVVSTNVGGLPEVIDASMGRLVNPSDAEALARECLDLIQSGDLASLGLAARVKAESMFSVEAMRLGTDAVYHELLSR